MKNIFKYKKRFLLLVGYLLFLTLAHQVNAAVTLRPVSSATCESKGGRCVMLATPELYDANTEEVVKDANCQNNAYICVKKIDQCLEGQDSLRWEDRTKLCIGPEGLDFHLYINYDTKGKLGESSDWSKISDLKCPGNYTCFTRQSNNSKSSSSSSENDKGCFCDNNGNWAGNCDSGRAGKPCCGFGGKYEKTTTCLGTSMTSCEDKGYTQRNDLYCAFDGLCCDTNGKSPSTPQTPENNPPSTSGKGNNPATNNPPTEIQKKHFCEGSPKAADVAKNPGNWDSLVLTYEECVYWSKSDTKDFQKFIAENDPNVSKMWKETLQKIQTQVKPIDGVSSGVFSNIQNEIKQMDAEIQKKQQEYAQNISRMLEPGANTPAQSPTNIDANKYANSPADQYRQACQQNTPSGVQSTVSNATCRPGWFGIIGYNVNNLNCCGKSADALACERQKGTMSFNTCGKKKTLITTVIDSKKVFCCK